jgi:hypothetical protein
VVIGAWKAFVLWNAAEPKAVPLLFVQVIAVKPAVVVQSPVKAGGANVAGTPVSEPQAHVVGNVAREKSPRKYCEVVPVVIVGCLPDKALHRSVWLLSVPVMLPHAPPPPLPTPHEKVCVAVEYCSALPAPQLGTPVGVPIAMVEAPDMRAWSAAVAAMADELPPC